MHFEPIAKVYVSNLTQKELKDADDDIVGRIEEIIALHFMPFVVGKFENNDIPATFPYDSTVDDNDFPVMIDIHLRPVERLNIRLINKDELAYNIMRDIKEVLTDRPNIVVDIYEPMRYAIGMSSAYKPHP
jgi:hypothetical protein